MNEVHVSDLVALRHVCAGYRKLGLWLCSGVRAGMSTGRTANRSKENTRKLRRRGVLIYCCRKSRCQKERNCYFQPIFMQLSRKSNRDNKVLYVLALQTLHRKEIVQKCDHRIFEALCLSVSFFEESCCVSCPQMW